MITKLKEVECPVCKKKVKENLIHKIPSGLKCSNCIKLERKNNRDKILHTVGGVRRRADLEKEWANKRKLVEEIIPPKIKGSKEWKPKNPSVSLYITREEKNFLWRKLIKQMNEDDANIRVKEICDYMSELVNNLRLKKYSNEQINIKFKEEFARIKNEI